jgi:hypothetical protein
VAANVPFYQGTSTVWPLRVYEVTLKDSKGPLSSISSFLNYNGVRTYTFTRDITGTQTPSSPIDGLSDSKG